MPQKKRVAKKSQAKSSPKGQTSRPLPISRSVLVQNDAKRRIVIAHRELARTVTVTTANQTMISLDLCPSNHATYPWLSHIAEAFECYRFRRLEVLYVPGCATTTAGRLTMAFDYDASDPQIGSRIELAMAYGARSGPLFSELKVAADSQMLNYLPFRYVSRSSTDARTSSPGTLYLATTEASANAVIGELYVDYELELWSPHYPEMGLFDMRFYSAEAGSMPLNGTPTVFANSYTGPAGAEGVVHKMNDRTFRYYPQGPGAVKLDVSVMNVSAVGTYTATATASSNAISFSTDGLSKVLTEGAKGIWRMVIKAGANLVWNTLSQDYFEFTLPVGLTADAANRATQILVTDVDEHLQLTS